ncbi:MAG: alpha/beta fold hydrolase [Actinobacteria bacterium]|nr:alpha/beta fold hydrolase [Actinomycetota bacterium]
MGLSNRDAAVNGPPPPTIDDAAGGDGRSGASADVLTPAARPRPLERTAFIGAVVAIVVYLLLEYFVFVRPGVDRGDHVLAVFLPAAILALCAELYGRLPAGLRASLSLTFGVIGLVTGAVQTDRLLVEGFSAGALCGLLPLAAGVVFLVIGGWVAWVSRKRGGPIWWTVVRRALIVVAALFLVYWVVLPVSFAVIATERPRDPVEAVDLGRPHQEVTLTTRDGLQLSAWYVPSQNKAAVVTYPRAWTIAQARMLVEQGYGVLLVDPRGYGDSEGDPNAYGWGSARDIDASVAWLRQRPDVQNRRVGGLGLSMGGEVMIEAAARNPGLKAVVSEGAGIRSVRESLLRRGPSWIEKALQYPYDLTQTISVWVLSGEPVPMSLRNASLLVGPRAVLFIYGEDGQEVEKAVNPVYYDAAFTPKLIWEVPGAGHTGGIAAQPEEYERIVLGFFDMVLLRD